MIRRACIAAVLLFSTLSAASPAAADNSDRHDRLEDSTLALTLNGLVHGVEVSGIREFLGIPYAAPPTGARRWQPPQPHAPWLTPLDATQFGKHCPQPEALPAAASASEDCLFLNVYSGSREHHDLDPVMVWIHGGSLVSGAGSDFDPSALVERGHVVVVTINYRLGALGFLAQPALDAEGHKFANYGLMDQQMALEWVHQNIAFFGGNPRNVTIFGESAGGQSVISHLTSPDSHGLFDRAIVESGAYALTIPPLALAEAQGTAFAASVGCADLDKAAACLRGVSVPTLVSKEASLYITTQDGQVLPAPPIQAFSSGQFNHTPVLQGSNHDEYRLFVATQFDLTGHPLTAAAYPAAIAAFPSIGVAKTPQVLAEYPLTNFPSPDLALATAMTDTLFSCSARRANQLMSNFVPVFEYEFSDENAPSFLPPVSFPYGAAHAFELSYLFRLSFLPAPTFTADQQTLADTMKGYWTRFAHNGRPNLPDAPHWPKYSASADDILSLVPPRPALESNFSAVHHCDFWRALSPAFD